MLLSLSAFFLLLLSGDDGNSLRAKIEASLHQAFGDSIAISSMQIGISPDIRQDVLAISRQRFDRDSLVIYVCTANGKKIGYGMVDDVKGKSRMITYMILLNLDESVRDVEILVYRESIGGEIVNESFRRQFFQKRYSDDLTLGSGIRNISGATISARAITNGVRKLLAAFHLLRAQLPK